MKTTKTLELILQLVILASIALASITLKADIKRDLIEQPRIEETSLAPGNSRASAHQKLLKKSSHISLLTVDTLSKTTELLSESEFKDRRVQFDLSNRSGLKALIDEIKKILAYKKQQKSGSETTGKAPLKISKSSVLGLVEMHNLAQLALLESTSNLDKDSAIAHIHTIAFAFNSNFIYPVPKQEWIIKGLGKLVNNGAIYDTPAFDIEDGKNDKGMTNPLDSTFWKNPGNIAKKDFTLSVNADQRLKLENVVCQYKKPHTGFGIHPAFYVTCKDASGVEIYPDDSIKLKFGNETHSGPFNTRIYSALGYNTDQVDYFPSLKVKYDRRIFSESNSNKTLTTVLTIIGIDKIPLAISGGDNPFENVARVVLKDSSQLKGAELPELLLINSKNLENNISAFKYNQLKDESNYREEFENKIDYLVMNEGTFTLKNFLPATEIGAWDYNDPSYSMRRDVRGVAFLSAFLNNYDIRWNNTAVSFIQTDSGYQVRESLSDVGSGLGCGKILTCLSNSDVEAFPKRWLYGKKYLREDDIYANERSMQANKFLFLNYNTNLPNRAYHHITRSDAQWMARKIAEIQPKQWQDALETAGFSATEVQEYLEILKARKDNMLQALGL